MNDIKAMFKAMADPKTVAENLARKSPALTEALITLDEYGNRVYTKKDAEVVKSALDLHIEKMTIAKNGGIAIEKVESMNKRQLLDYIDLLELQKAEEWNLEIKADEQRKNEFGGWS